MAARIIDIADGVVDVLNAASLGQTIAAVRHSVPLMALEVAAENDDLNVLVAPSGDESQNVTRNDDREDVRIDVAIVKKIDATTNAVIDPLVLFVQEAADLFKRLLIEHGDATGRCITVTKDPLYDQDKLKDHRLFIAIFRLTVRMTH